MFYQTGSFRAMEAGLSAAWLQQKLHTQNLSNVETPDYKAKKLVFSEALNAEEADITAGGKSYNYNVVSRDDTSVRLDGNNVDEIIEGIELYKSYVQYSALIDKLKTEFTNYQYVLTNGPR